MAKFTLELDIPPGVSVEQMRDHIETEVAASTGHLMPEDPMWHLNGDSVKVIAECGVPTVDIDQAFWQSIKIAAEQSTWLPKEFFMNDWVAMVRGFLLEGPKDTINRCISLVRHLHIQTEGRISAETTGMLTMLICAEFGVEVPTDEPN